LLELIYGYALYVLFALLSIFDETPDVAAVAEDL
jgi:hypothetical protein